MGFAADVRCARVAAGQHGLLTRRQALDAGLSRYQIDHRTSQEVWRIVHPSVYAIGGVPGSWHQELLAACLWAGGLASHRSAAVLWDLSGFSPQSVRSIDVTVTRCHLPPRCGIRLHHTNRLLDSDRTVIDNVPATNIERTLLDLGAACRQMKVASALDAALTRGLTTLEDLDEYLRLVARRGRRGCKTLRTLIRQRSAIGNAPQSPLETKFFQLLVEEGLPLPELQYEIIHDGRFIARADFAWPTQKVILEMDGYKYHSGHSQWESDRNRRNELTLLGWRILHGTWSEAKHRAPRLLGRVAAALAQPS